MIKELLTTGFTEIYALMQQQRFAEAEDRFDALTKEIEAIKNDK